MLRELDALHADRNADISLVVQVTHSSSSYAIYKVQSSQKQTCVPALTIESDATAETNPELVLDTEIFCLLLSREDSALIV